MGNLMIRRRVEGFKPEDTHAQGKMKRGQTGSPGHNSKHACIILMT